MGILGDRPMKESTLGTKMGGFDLECSVEPDIRDPWEGTKETLKETTKKKGIRIGCIA